MRSKFSSRTRTYLIPGSVWINLVDLRTLGRIANPLQNRSFACIRSSDNEDSELDVCDSGGTLLCSHSTKGLSEKRRGEGDDRMLDSAGTLYQNLVQTSADCCRKTPLHLTDRSGVSMCLQQCRMWHGGVSCDTRYEECRRA